MSERTAPVESDTPFRYTAELADSIETAWQDRWEAEGTFNADNPVGALAGPGADKEKFFLLDMFPYPSGKGLHVGHPLGYIATDVVARFTRMTGKNVLYTMGYDAFGLPAEQYAVQTGQHPRISTEANIANMRRQLRRLGLSHDPRRSLATIDVDYVRWTQWIFLQVFNSWFDPEAPRRDGRGKGAARPVTELRDKLASGEVAVPGGRDWAGLSAAEQFASAQEGYLKAFLVAGVDPYDMPEADSALHALRKSFVVHVSTRANAVTEVADVVFPACLMEEQAGHFLNWEQRIRPVALVNEGTRHPMSDLRILAALADAMGADLGFRTSAAAWADFQELGEWEGERVAVPRKLDAGVTQGGVVVASWREALDATSGIDFEIALRRTARPAVARMSPATAAAFGIGELCRIEAPGSSQLLPVQLTEMVDGVVWVPMNPGEPGRLGVVPGSIVTVAPASSDEGDQE
mgnify:CR=1 FL=1